MKVRHIWNKSQRGRFDDCMKTYVRDGNTWNMRVVNPADAQPAKRGDIDDSSSMAGWLVWFKWLDNIGRKSWSPLSPNSSSEIDESFVCQFGLIANNQSYPPSWVSTLWLCLDSCRFMISDGFGNNAFFEVLTHNVNEFLWLVYDILLSFFNQLLADPSSETQRWYNKD